MNELQFLILDSFIDSWNFKAICKFEGKSQTQSKVENNTANLIQSAPISMPNLTGKSEHQPAKNNVIKTNYFTSSDSHHDMLGGGCQVRVVI